MGSNLKYTLYSKRSLRTVSKNCVGIFPCLAVGAIYHHHFCLKENIVESTLPSILSECSNFSKCSKTFLGNFS